MESVVKCLWNFKGPVVIDLHMGTISSKILSIKVNTFLTHVCFLFFVCTVSAFVIRVSYGAYSDIISYL